MIKGVVGHIRWGYYTAAAINGFTVTPLDKRRQRWSLQATVVLADSFKMAQRPLTFVAKLKGGAEWRWPILEMERQTIRGMPVLTARLGPEASDGAVPVRSPRV